MESRELIKKSLASMPNKLLLVGNADETHVGANLLHAAKELNLEVQFFDVKEAFKSPTWVGKINWWLRGHRPTRLRQFSSEFVHHCREFKPHWMLAVGLAPLEAGALKEIGLLGVHRMNYLTDNPWNPAHRAGWFLKSLPYYDHIFSTRRSSLSDLKRIGCPRVSFLPFAYMPELHFPESPQNTDEQSKFDCDVVFVGGADRDRLPYIKALLETGLKVGLYGGYWEHFSETKAHTRGPVDPERLRKVIGGAKVALCLVRKANRDGNSMRTFEIPAIGACMLTEDTKEHREIFGEDGQTVAYFKTRDEMVKKLRFLLGGKAERERLAVAAHDLIVKNRNTYKDRLVSMLQTSGGRNRCAGF